MIISSSKQLDELLLYIDNLRFTEYFRVKKPFNDVANNKASKFHCSISSRKFRSNCKLYMYMSFLQILSQCHRVQLQLHIKPKGPAFNMSVTLPLLIGTIPLQNVVDLMGPPHQTPITESTVPPPYQHRSNYSEYKTASDPVKVLDPMAPLHQTSNTEYKAQSPYK